MVLPLNSGRCLDNEWMVSLGRRLAADGPLPQLLISSLTPFSKKNFFFNFLAIPSSLQDLGFPPPGIEPMPQQ